MGVDGRRGADHHGAIYRCRDYSPSPWHWYHRCGWHHADAMAHTAWARHHVLLTWWRRMRRAHAEDGMCITVLLLLLPLNSSIADFVRRNARYLPYTVVGLRWLWLERLRPDRPPKFEPERTPSPPTSKEGRAMNKLTWAIGDSDNREREKAIIDL